MLSESKGSTSRRRQSEETTGRGAICAGPGRIVNGGGEAVMTM